MVSKGSVVDLKFGQAIVSNSESAKTINNSTYRYHNGDLRRLVHIDIGRAPSAFVMSRVNNAISPEI